MAQRRNNLSIADACHLFESLAGFHPQSAKELKDGYRAWMKAHHPDITGNRDPLSMEAVQWMNAAYDVLKTQDWTKATADTAPEWTGVDEKGKRKEQEKRERAAAAKRYRQQQAKTKQEKEQEEQRRMREIKRRVEARKNRYLWQKILWGDGSPFSDEGLSNPGFLWCCLNLFGVMFGLGIPVGIVVIILNQIIKAVTTQPPFLFYWSDFGILWAIACMILLGSMWVSWLVNRPKKKRHPRSESFYFLGFICMIFCLVLIARMVDHQRAIAQATNQAVIHQPPSNTQDTNTSNWPTTYSPYSPQCKDGKFTQGFFEAYNAVCARKGDGAWTPPVAAPDPSGTAAPHPSGTSNLCQPPRRMTARDGCQ